MAKLWTMDEVAYGTPRDLFGKVLIELGRENKRIVVLSPDVLLSTRVRDFAEEFPERAFETGVTEQTTAGMAAGMATCGLIPFYTSLACFASMRDLEQVRTDIAYPNLNVKIIGTHTGLSGGPMGTTHHSTEDMAIMRSLANMVVIAPSDPFQIVKILKCIVEYEGPCYIRLITGKGSSVMIYESVEQCPFEIGKSTTVRDGNDITVIAAGNPAVQNSFVAANELEKEGIHVRVIDMPTIKPIDKEAVVKAADETSGIVTVEDHTIVGGLGGAVAEVLAEEKPAFLKRVGLPDIYSAIGPQEALWARYGLDSDSLTKTIKGFIKEIGK